LGGKLKETVGQTRDSVPHEKAVSWKEETMPEAWYNKYQGVIIVVVLIIAGFCLWSYATNYQSPPSCDEAPWQEGCWIDEPPSEGF